jgi:cardiolipin synthase
VTPRPPRSNPRLFDNRPHLRRRPSYRPPPDPRHTPPKGVTTLWTHVRRLIWSWWPWALVVLYLVDKHQLWGAFGVALWCGVCALSTPAEFPPQYGYDHDLEVGSEDFLDTMAGAAGVPFARGNTLKLLNNGDEFYPEMLAAIKTATRSITIEAYIYWAGEIGMTFAKALAEAAQRGVRVKVLVDAVGSASVGQEILQILEKGGCHLAWYNPFHLTTLRRINNRTHRKSLICDGQVGFTGGAGIADHWTGNAQDAKHWRDLQIRLEGPAVRPLQSGFAQNWLEATSELIWGPYFYPAPLEVGRLSVQTVMSSPETGASTVHVMYYVAISSARKTIDIANPYFVPDHVAIDLFRDAAKRGVRVRVMVAGISNDTWITRKNSLRLYGTLLDAGIELYEYNRTMMHHKTMIVDGLWSTVGTANFDNRSFSHNEESNISLCDEGFARELTDTFEKDMAVCQRVTKEQWQRRGLFEKGLEALASFVQDQV